MNAPIKLTTQQLLDAMKPKPKVEVKTEEVKEVTSPLGMDDIVIPVPRKENPSPILDVPEKRKEIKIESGSTKTEPTTDDLLVQIIIQLRRTNTLLDQMRLISLGLPISDYNAGAKENGEG